MPSVSTAENPFQLRPQSVVVLTNEEKAARPSTSSGMSSVQTRSTLASLVSVFLILRL